MQRLALFLSLAVGGPSTILCAQTASASRSTPADMAAFSALMSSCASLGEPFTLFLGPEATWPISVQVGQHLPAVLFGAPTTARDDTPTLRLDLADFALVPSAATVRRWPSDSNWAFTKCELLGHEASEALELQRLTREDADSILTTDTKYARRLSRAHKAGLETELRVAGQQRTRADSTGRPYGRRYQCFLNEGPRPQLGLVLGQNSVLYDVTGSELQRIFYISGVDVCATY